MFETTNEGLTLQKVDVGQKALVVDSSRLEACIKFIHESNIKRILINPYKGYTLDNIEFLNDLSDVLEGLNVPSTKFDIKVINKLYKLKVLGVPDNHRDVLDLSNFPNLADLSCEYSNRLVGLGLCKKLKKLSITKYAPSRSDLTEIPVGTELEELTLYFSGITSLQGIEKQPNLQKIVLYQASKLQTIQGLAGHRTLNEVEFEKCKHIQDYEVLATLANLVHLRLVGCDDIKSLHFLSTLKKLQTINFQGTNVLDGDLSVLDKRLQYVGFDNKKHYNFKLSKFEKRNSEWMLDQYGDIASR